MSHGQAGEDWYFPPIFGLGLVFNSYSIRTSRHSIAFNYPSAIGQTLDTNSIESLAELLLSKYLEKNKLPKKIDRIVAYSMGAIVAFEVIKQLELRGTKVEELIIWDKPAQIKYEPELPIQLHPSIMHYVEQLAFDQAQREKMLRYLTIHQEMIEHYHQKGRIESNIQLYYCKKGFEESAMNDWCQLTNGKTTLIELPAEVSHYDIPTYWKSS